MKLSERQAIFVRALRGAFGDELITTREVSTRITGGALKVPGNAELLQAIVGCRGRVITAEKIGRLLETVRGRRLGDLELVADGEKVGGRWRYYVKDHAAAPIPAPDLVAIRAEAEARAEAYADKIMGLSPSGQARAVDAVVNRAARAERDVQREADRKTAASVVDELHDAEAFERTQQAARDAEGDPTRLHMRETCRTEAGLEIVNLVHRPENGVECRLTGTHPTRGILILLRGSWPERKRIHELLCALWRKKAWPGSGYAQVFDGVTSELLHGREIPSTASQDPAHYNTAAGHERLAIQLLVAGIGSNELSLADYAYQQRGWAWGHGVGGGLHRASGLHSDPGGAIRMRKFDPLAGQIEAACGEPEFMRNRK